jgi:hypothetical protein
MNQERFNYYLYAQNKDKIRKKLTAGDIDYGSLSEMKFVDKFFAFVLATDFFDFAEDTYPGPRARKEQPGAVPGNESTQQEVLPAAGSFWKESAAQFAESNGSDNLL